MFIDDNLKTELQKHLSLLTKKVKILFFTQELECMYCKETKQLVEELVQVSDQLELKIKNFVIDKEDVEKYGVDKVPATILLDENGNDYGIKFYGIPSGYEFTSLLEDILILGTEETGLSEEITNQIKSITEPVHLQVFVTPTCPYCPRAVVAASKFAYINPKIKADMIEATEFPNLSNKYNVRGVPRTVINETEFIEGAAPEEMVLDKIFQIINQN